MQFFTINTKTGKGAIAMRESVTLTENTLGPVVVVLTKVDGLESRIFNCLCDHGRTARQAVRQLPGKTKHVLNERWIQPVTEVEYPPADHICLKSTHLRAVLPASADGMADHQI